MKSLAAFSAIALALVLGAQAGMAADQSGPPPYAGEWTLTPTGNGGAESTITFAPGGSAIAQQGTARYQAQWQEANGFGYWFWMVDGEATQAFRFSLTAPAGGGYSCQVDNTDINFDCMDNGYNFSMKKTND